MLYDMGGADDKSQNHRILRQNFFEVIWLESQFNAEFILICSPNFSPGASRS